MILLRSDGSEGAGEFPPVVVPLNALPTQQRRIVEAIEFYQKATGDPCPATWLGRRFKLHHSTVQGHLAALHRKGWLTSPNAPALIIRRR